MKTKENLLSLGNVIFLLDAGGNNPLKAYRIRTMSSKQESTKGDSQ